MITFEQALEIVEKLPLEQQELLIDILQRRTNALKRQELAKTSQEALAEFHSGILTPQTSEKAIAELNEYLNTEEDR